jgi:hypothetical protein
MNDKMSFEELIREHYTEYSLYRNRLTSFNTIKRIKNIYKTIDYIIRNKCAEEYARVEDVCNRNELNQFVPIEGKEDEAALALQKLKKCPYNFSLYQKKIKSINEISEIILENQLEICLHECSVSDGDDNICVKDCFFKGYDNTMRAFEQYLNTQLTIIENKINII